MIFKPGKFRLFDEGVDVEILYKAEYWWLDGDGRAWVRLKETQQVHEVVGDLVEIRIDQ